MHAEEGLQVQASEVLISFVDAQVVEIVMDLGRPPLARFPAGDLRLSEEVITLEDLQHAIDRVCRARASLRLPSLKLFWQLAPCRVLPACFRHHDAWRTRKECSLGLSPP